MRENGEKFGYTSTESDTECTGVGPLGEWTRHLQSSILVILALEKGRE